LRPIKRIQTKGSEQESKTIIQRVNLEQVSNEIENNIDILKDVRDRLQA